MECIAQLRHTAGDFDGLVAGIHFRHIEAVVGEPGGDGGNVLVGRAKLSAKLIWRKPLVVTRRARRVHLVDELLQRGFLRVTAFENQVHSVELQAVGRGSQIVSRGGERAHGAVERYQLGVVD